MRILAAALYTALIAAALVSHKHRIEAWILRHRAGAVEESPASLDGFGQSAVDDARFAVRFRKCRRQSVMWRTPTEAEAEYWETHPTLGRFGGPGTDAVAEVDGRLWVLRSRLWFGWPDPPEFVFFAMEGDQVWAAADFAHIPRNWTMPSAPPDRT